MSHTFGSQEQSLPKYTEHLPADDPCQDPYKILGRQRGEEEQDPDFAGH